MIDFDANEKKTLKFWEKEKIFQKLVKKNKGKKRWSFIDGPITANNPMGVHHAWGRTYKDLFHRFKAMQGYEMRYQNGFDTQGLWVEREEEKDLGLKNKDDIEKFGILKFVQACKKRVEKFSKVQRDQSIRLGYWMDWENSYYTMTDNNNLHNWMLLKLYFDKGWLYKGNDSVPWCWRCGTASSKHDIATEGYKEVTHDAMFMQFPMKDDPNTYFLVFTTTPWTVPANVAIAVNSNVEYVKVKQNEACYWLAHERLEVLDGDHVVLEKKMGNDLKDLEYVMPYANMETQKEAPHKVVLWDLASEEEGTGIVHIAPGCGAEDYDLGKKEGLPVVAPLDSNGIYMEGFGELGLKKYSDVNTIVLEDMEQRRFIYKIEKIKHRYPHCWRCGNELVFRVVDEWYIKCDKMRDILIKANRKTKWYPEYGKQRQEAWFNNMSDWLISRKRYWGLPLPIWECKCGNIDVVGSLDELKKIAVDKSKVDNLKEIHRPWIDEILIKCTKCGEGVERIKDVGDAWLDAGIVPFSTLNYLDDKEHWKKWYPADLISENMPGQFRGWFNSLFWASGAITGKSPFKQMFGYETLKDEKGQEMHKSKGNAIWFDDAVEKIGADPIRLLYSLQDPSQELKFGYNVVKEPKNSLNILSNIRRLIGKSEKVEVEKIEDKWIFSVFNTLVKNVTGDLERFRPHSASRALQDFWLNKLSRGYIQIVRDRISKNDKETGFVLGEIYLGLLKLCAPIIPFITEESWQNLREKKIVSKKSVHLCDWPKPDVKKISKKLEEEFENAFLIIEGGLAIRDKEQMGLKWPLSKATVYTTCKINKDLGGIVAKQLNVKEIMFTKKGMIKAKAGRAIEVKLDLKLTPELEAEGFAREISRRVQSERKKRGLEKSDVIELKLLVGSKLQKRLEKHKDFILERTGSKNIEFVDDKNNKMVDFVVRGNKLGFLF